MLKEQYIDKTRVAVFGKVSHTVFCQGLWTLEVRTVSPHCQLPSESLRSLSALGEGEKGEMERLVTAAVQESLSLAFVT